jgi:hypothetical protein
MRVIAMANHQLMDGKVQLYRRGNSLCWQCAASVGGKQRRTSTKEENIVLAKQIAEDWYLELRGKDRAGVLDSGPTFSKAVEQFLNEYGSSPKASAARSGPRATERGCVSTSYRSLAPFPWTRSLLEGCRNTGFIE